MPNNQAFWRPRLKTFSYKRFFTETKMSHSQLKMTPIHPIPLAVPVLKAQIRSRLLGEIHRSNSTTSDTFQKEGANDAAGKHIPFSTWFCCKFSGTSTLTSSTATALPKQRDSLWFPNAPPFLSQPWRQNDATGSYTVAHFMSARAHHVPPAHSLQ